MNWEPLEREKAVKLLEEIRENCISSGDSQEVSIAENPQKEGYLLRVKWAPTLRERRFLRKMVEKYKVEAVMVSGYLVFRKPKVSES